MGHCASNSDYKVSKLMIKNDFCFFQKFQAKVAKRLHLFSLPKVNVLASIHLI